MGRPLSAFPPRAATKTLLKKSGGKNRERNRSDLSDRCQRSRSLQQLLAFSAVEKIGCRTRERRPQNNPLLFFYPDAILYICDNQLNKYPHDKSI